MSVEEEIESLKLRITAIETSLYGKSPKIVPDEGITDKESKPRPPKKKIH